MKKYIGRWIVFSLAVLLILSGCSFSDIEGKRPIDQDQTTWVTEDESVVLYTSHEQDCTGTILHGQETVEIVWNMSVGSRIIFVHDKNTAEYIEMWVGSFKEEDRFTVTVEETTYFTVGQTLTFERVEPRGASKGEQQ